METNENMDTNGNKGMTGADMNTVISALTLMLSTVLTELIPNMFLKALFIVCYIISIAFFHTNYKQADKLKKWISIVFGIVSVIILLGSNLTNGVSFEDCLSHFVSFFGTAKSEETDRAEDTSEILKRLEVRVDSLTHDKGLYRLCASKESPKEITAILDLIQKREAAYKEGHDDEAFPDFKTDRQQTELFYKMWLTSTEEPYSYYNIIKAFESLGMDCEKLEIDEYTLALWDTEYLFSIYNMRKSLENTDDESSEDMEFRFQDFKAKDMNEFSDSLDYGSWQIDYEDVTAETARENLDSEIINCYKKLYRNFNID